MLNFNQSDTNANFACQMDQIGAENTNSSTSCAAVPSAYPDQQQQNYPLMANFNNSGRGRSASPGLNHERFFDNSNIQDSVHQTPDVFPFVLPNSAKGSENVKRFSVNNLLQLAQCTSANNLMSSGRSLGEKNHKIINYMPTPGDHITL